MDPSLYVQYSSSTGLPQESKLATYMNRSASTPSTSLNQSMSKLSMESSPTSNKKPEEFSPDQQQAGQFIPDHEAGQFIPDHEGRQFIPDHEGRQFIPDHEAGQFIPDHEAGLFFSDHEAGPFSPNRQAGQFIPDHEAGPFSPNRQAGQFIPDHEGGLFNPDHQGGLYIPDYQGGLFNPDLQNLIPIPQQGPHIFLPQHQLLAPPQMYSPNHPQAMFSPNQPQPIYSPNQQQTLYNAAHQQMGLFSPNQQPMFTPPHPVMIAEFVPLNYFAPALLPESPENSPPTNLPLQVNTQIHQENVGGTTYFYPTSSDTLTASVGLATPSAMGGECITVSPYATQMYVPVPIPLMHTAATVDNEWLDAGLAASFYMPETIRTEVYNKTGAEFLQADLRHYQDLPETLDVYADLNPLEPGSAHAIATTYRVTHRSSGEYYAMRRLHACTAPPLSTNKSIDIWRNVDHPNVVRLLRVFASKDFGDHSLVLVYDYHPASSTLMSKYLSGAQPGSGSEGNGAFHDPFSSDPDAPRPYTHQKNAMLRAVACGALLPEAVLWSILVQLTAGLRAIHTSGLACRTLDPTKVIMNGCRVRISWCGIADAVQNNNIDITQAQQEDLIALGRLALALACRSIHCENLPACMDIISRTYSPDLKNLILYLLSSSATRRSVNDLMPMIGARFYTQVEALQRRGDAFEDQLTREIDNGRLLRILVKLGVVNERPELNLDPTWSETGDRYMLKLFRDYIFHSITNDGRPWIDQAHVANALNHLDAGSKLKVELMSRDEQSVLVVTYAELKHCLDAAFEEVMTAAGVDRNNFASA